MTELEKMEKGLDYSFYDPEVAKVKERALKLCTELNQTPIDEYEKREELARSLFGGVGKGTSIQPNFFCDNGKNIYVDHDFLTNYNVTILDIAPVMIGNDVMIGPNTVIATVGHPLSPAKRTQKTATSRLIKIGNNVWIGANCTILPGVRIGDNSVIAARAVVNKNIPANVVVAGVQATIIKELT